MSANNLLTDVKNALGIAGTYQDATIQIYIDEVKGFLSDAGVSEANMSAGVIARGVSDLWNYGAADGQLSDYFKMRAIQLACKR